MPQQQGTLPDLLHGGWTGSRASGTGSDRGDTVGGRATWQLSSAACSLSMLSASASCLEWLSWLSFCRLHFFCWKLALSSATWTIFSINW